MPASTPIKTSDGRRFQSVNVAADFLGIKRTTLMNRIEDGIPIDGVRFSWDIDDMRRQRWFDDDAKLRVCATCAKWTPGKPVGKCLDGYHAAAGDTCARWKESKR